jgi:hypothetical protein
MNHHLADYRSACGVSNPLWDVIFATTPAVAKPAKQSTSGGLPDLNIGAFDES